MFLVLVCAISLSNPDASLMERARTFARSHLILDGHIDLPYRLIEKMEDVTQRTDGGDFDYPRARRGGLDAPFMSIYIPARMEDDGAKEHADRLIDLVDKLIAESPDKFARARSPEDLIKNFKANRISLPMGMENGAAIEGDLKNLQHFYDRGIRYITLAHSKANHICDSSYDSNRRWHGLSPFGRELVAAMNQLGVMIDVAHISDETFAQVMELSRAPVIASHSSCRAFTPGLERNMSDDMIRALAKHGGVIQINFGSYFIKQESREAGDRMRPEIEKIREEHREAEAKALVDAYRSAHPYPRADVTDVADHIDHVVDLVGIEHVGLGSDFDGVGDSLPTGLRDVSDYPNLIYQLFERGYSEQDVEKICSGNVLRVWRDVERVAKEMP